MKMPVRTKKERKKRDPGDEQGRGEGGGACRTGYLLFS